MSSGLDVQGLVDKLMVAESNKLVKLQAAEQKIVNQTQQVQRIQTLLHAFATSINDQTTLLNQSYIKALSSDEKIISATATSNNLPLGAHSIEVLQKAQAHQVVSIPYSSKSSALGINETLSIHTNSQNISLDIAATDTLEMIRDKINIANNQEDVSAFILTTTNVDNSEANRLVLSSTRTGQSESLTIDLTALTFTDLQAAKDAQLKFDGFLVTRSSNTINDLLQGLTLNINSDIGNASINIDKEPKEQQDVTQHSLEIFISKYNEIIEAIDKAQSNFNLRDTAYSTVKNMLKKVVDDFFSNGALGTMGIKSAKAQENYNDQGGKYTSYGRLELDISVFNTAMSKNPVAINQWLQGANGLFPTLTTTLNSLETSDNFIDERKQRLSIQENSLENQIAAEKSKLTDVEKALRRQYSALDSFIQRYANLSAMLDSQFSNNKQK